MEKTTRVKALSISGRAYYVLRWKDASGSWRDKTTEIPNTPRNRSKAAKAAADHEAVLNETPVADRHGLVFPLGVTKGQASRVIADVGKMANVVTCEDGGCATAHDLRRSFGTRWASKVHPAELQKLMRHADISTTMKFYVRLDSAALAQKLASLGESSGETTQKRPTKKRSVESP